MTKLNPVNKITVTFLIFVLTALIITSCKKKRSEMASVLFKQTHNKVFRDVTAEGFAEVFKKVFADEKSELRHPDFIANYYEENDYRPVFVMDHLFNGDLQMAADYYAAADEHGLKSELFDADEISELIHRLNDKNSIKTVDEAYHDMAELELVAANSLINYTNALQYGIINPKNIYQRYFMATKRPDSTTMLPILSVKSFKTYFLNWSSIKCLP